MKDEKVIPFVGDLGRVFGLDLIYFFKNGFWVGLRYGIISVFGLILSAGFARMGTKDLLGQYQFILSFTALFSLFSLPGLNISAMKSIAQGSGNIVIRKAVRLSFLFGLASIPPMLAYTAYRFFIQGTIGSPIAIALTTAAFFSPFFYAPNTWYAAYEGRSLFRPVAIRMVIASFGTTVATLIGLYFKLEIQFLILLYFLLSAAFSWYFFTELTWVREEKKEQDTEKLDVRYGVEVTLQKFAYGLSDNIPPIVISFLLGFELLAIFQIAYFFTNAITSLVGALFAMYLPKLFNAKKVVFKNALLQSLLAGILCFFGLSLFIKIGFYPLYGKAYTESYTLAWMLAPLLILSPIRIFLVNYFTAQGKNNMIIIFSIIANIIGIGVFSLLKNESPFLAITSYMYVLTCCIVIPLLWLLFYGPKRYTTT